VTNVRHYFASYPDFLRSYIFDPARKKVIER
jgi:hypothetical protein